eukprot:879817-Alexandrium_andersonii.AAC.1
MPGEADEPPQESTDGGASGSAQPAPQPTGESPPSPPTLGETQEASRAQQSSQKPTAPAPEPVPCLECGDACGFPALYGR